MIKNIIFSYHFFYFLQGLFKYFPFKFLAKIRAIIYRPFFKNIGNNVIIHDAVSFKFPAEITLGDNVQIAEQCIFVGISGLEIRKNVLIGAGTKIITSTHNHNSLLEPMIKQGLSFKPIIIEEDVWFGFNCVILGGAIIKRGTIVGANAVVLEGVYDEFSVLGGIPAKILKKRINNK